MPALFGKRYWSVFSLAIVLFTLVTAEYAVDFQDGVWSNSTLWGFPLPYAHYGVVTSMEPYFYAVPLVIDLFVYLFIASFVTSFVEALGFGRYLSQLSVPLMIAALVCLVLMIALSVTGYWQLFLNTHGDPIHFRGWTTGIFG